MSFKRNGLLKETLIYSIGSFSSKVLSYLLVPLYTFLLTEKEVGEFDVFLTTIGLFTPIVSLQISDAAYRWIISSEDKSKAYISKVFTNTCLIFVIAFFIFAIGFAVYSFFNSFSYSNYFIVLLFFSCLFPLLQNVLRAFGKTKEFALNGVLTTFIIVFLNLIFLYFLQLKVEGILLANIIAYAVGSLIIFVKFRMFNLIDITLIDNKEIKDMLAYSLPLVPNIMGWWLISSASKFIILNHLGLEANGIYAISNRIPTILVVINSVLVMPVQDAYLKNKDTTYLGKLINKIFVLQMLLVLVLSVGAPIYMKFMVSERFYESWKYMPFIYLGVAFNTVAALLGLYYQLNKKTWKITSTTLLGAFISLSLCYFFIDYGLHIASISFAVGFILVFAFRFYDTKILFTDSKTSSIYILLFLFLISTFLSERLAFNFQLVLFFIITIVAIYPIFSQIKKKEL